jgi:50S ribosomal subunit-associated GTPase HflX
VEEEIEIPVEKSKLISQIHSLATVSNIEYGDEVAVLKIRTDKNNFAKLKKLLL